LLAVAVWEAVNAAIERHLARLTREAQAARSARLRTLLPLLRTTLSIAIIVVAGMMLLSEIGVNIGPLLAGAGIVGVAIGFGSQKLVQDLITGIFLLLENAMQVGDSVTVSGLSGTVENLSVRTIRLRAGDGSIHIIPFSSVTTVTNVNRGLGNASVSVCVAGHEDTDRICATLKEIVAAMREEADFSPKMLSDLQLWGVDKVDGASVTIAGQVVCTDFGRWNVQREFNRRMKKRFEELGIELYNPTQRMVAVRQVTDNAVQDDRHEG
jgi:moderate conductance mechanosensitive channel